MTEIWMWRESIYPGRDLSGFEVEATDSRIGSIDDATDDFGAGHLVVDTGWWITGAKRLLPAGLVERIDFAAGKVYISCTKDQVKDAPDFDDSDAGSDETYRREIGHHYRFYSLAKGSE